MDRAKVTDIDKVVLVSGASNTETGFVKLFFLSRRPNKHIDQNIIREELELKASLKSILRSLVGGTSHRFETQPEMSAVDGEMDMWEVSL